MRILPYGHLTASFDSGLFIDKIPTGFLTWSDSVKAYLPAADMPSISTWESAAAPALESVHEFLVSKEYFKQLSALWGQESSVDVPVLDVRTHNLDLIKSLSELWSLVLFVIFLGLTHEKS